MRRPEIWMAQVDEKEEDNYPWLFVFWTKEARDKFVKTVNLLCGRQLAWPTEDSDRHIYESHIDAIDYLRTYTKVPLP